MKFAGIYISRLLDMKKSILPIAWMVFATSTLAQTTIETELIYGGPLAAETVCGGGPRPPIGRLSGLVKKRDFAEDELMLSGFVLADSRDRRHYVNIDSEFVSGAWSSAVSDLGDTLSLGSRVQIETISCGRLLYLYRLLPPTNKKAKR